MTIFFVVHIYSCFAQLLLFSYHLIVSFIHRKLFRRVMPMVSLYIDFLWQRICSACHGHVVNKKNPEPPLAWENSRRFARSPLEPTQNAIWVTSAEISYWWRALPRSWQCFWLVERKFPRGTKNQEHYQDLGSDTSSVWNFCARYSEVVLRGLKWRPRETSAVFSGRCAALTRSSLIWWENNRTNNRSMDPSPKNNRAAWYQGPMKLEVVKSCVVSGFLRLNLRRKSNPWPSVHPSSALTTELLGDSEHIYLVYYSATSLQWSALSYMWHTSCILLGTASPIVSRVVITRKVENIELDVVIWNERIQRSSVLLIL